jgi:hypothetical protein
MVTRSSSCAALRRPRSTSECCRSRIRPNGDPALLKTAAYEGGARLSPDGIGWSMSPTSPGRTTCTCGRSRRSIDAGDLDAGRNATVWNPNGKEIFYRSGDKMMSVDVTTTPTSNSRIRECCSSSAMPLAGASPFPTTM